MSVAHELQVMADGEQLHMASRKMLCLPARIGLCLSGHVLWCIITGLADVWWCVPFVQV